MNNFDKFINRFTSDIRTWSEEPRPQDGQIYATDTYVMARVAEHLCEATYSVDEKQPNFSSVLPKERTCSLSMDIRKVAKAISQVPVEEFKELEDAEEICEECFGTGYVTWEYEDTDGETHENDFECPICSGLGRLSRKLILREDRNICINGIWFKIGNIQRIVDAISELGVVEVEVQHLVDKKPMLIHVCKDVEVIVMPSNKHETGCIITLQ